MTTPTNQRSETEDKSFLVDFKSYATATETRRRAVWKSDYDQLSQQLATALEANKNANALIGATAEECKTIVAKLEGQLATAIAERDAWLTKHDKLMDKVEAVLEHNHKVETHNQSLTTLCAKLDNALRCANNCYCGDSYGQKVIDEALTHYTEHKLNKERNKICQ